MGERELVDVRNTAARSRRDNTEVRGVAVSNERITGQGGVRKVEIHDSCVQKNTMIASNAGRREKIGKKGGRT